jgi:hypothetical protein
MINATANPITLYFFKNATNSSAKFLGFGGGGSGFGVNSSLICLNSSNISSSLAMYSPPFSFKILILIN